MTIPQFAYAVGVGVSLTLFWQADLRSAKRSLGNMIISLGAALCWPVAWALLLLVATAQGARRPNP